ncbi:mannose-1-phosphate guanylyltransferase/mannose-6-phosphate isomerase [Paraburkholderia sp. BL6665CI2N2]|uniref:sugar phosphate nucleotidyltransferase n=1 Tax=Paraburkholderia sp. BL6665CI2N2 TaxID=1938806 RepID=UPI001066CDBE|nr:sugar phosphate nucleotidyltransferase [Paraburkholderia sp. BL6665CI2N2]TDY26334.1 mannose-1-phosphate guanylyltransferase/mannose-6-phosphate isomerase [Paraburkholderia sp. BL6665CI2N2]
MNRIVEPGNPLASVGGVGETATRLSVQPVILAQGSGTRSSPLSRERDPKRSVDLTGDASRLETTLSRLNASFAVAQHTTPSSIARSFAVPLVICCEDLHQQTRESGERLARSGRPVRMVLEPMSRDTAPALTVAALAACAPAVEGDDPLIVALPADYLIADHVAFGAALAEALEHATRGAIVTLGVPPKRAETGCSYIRTGMALGKRGARAIERLAEKPDPELAERYAASGNYWWNSGMVVARASVWLAAVALCQPAIAEACAAAFEHAMVDGDGTLHLSRDAWALCPSASIDCAVMERIGTDARLAGVAVPLVTGHAETSARDPVMRVTRGEECFMLAAKNPSTYVPPGIAHRLEKLAMTPREMIEVQSGGYPGEDDIVRLEDPFARNLESAHARKAASR